MCVIAICPDRKLTDEEFDNCWESNRHGFGCAYWTGDEVIMKKGMMNKDEALAYYKTVKHPHVAHFRIASAGGVCPELTHPFLCTPKSGLLLEHTGTGPVLFHNGTLSDWKNLLVNAIFQTKVIPRGPMSDSRTMAIVVSQLGAEFLDMYSSQKWVIVGPKGYTKVGDWVEEGGVMFSNGSFRSFWNVYPSYSQAPQKELFSQNWKESERSVTLRQGRSCADCIEELDGYCVRKQRILKDNIACGDFERYDPEVDVCRAADEHGYSIYKGIRRCSNCVKVDIENRVCLEKQSHLKDDHPCKEHLAKGEKGWEEWGIGPAVATGAQTVVGKDGTLVAVQENYLDRLEALQRKGEG